MNAFPGELLNHLWQSTLFAGVIGLVTLALRKNRAAIRFGLWLAASIKFLIPFSLLVYLGGGLVSPLPTDAPAAGTRPIASSTPVADAEVQTSAGSLIDAIAEPLALAAPVAAPATAIPLQIEWQRPMLIGVLLMWAAGFVFNVFGWLREWRNANRRLRSAVQLEVDVPARIPAMGSPAAIEPSVFGILRPVLLLPQNILDDLTPEQVESILLHESAHVDRRDNLAAAIHMAVEAIFWFNPAVWWIGARLVDERERACDEAVLRRFDEPRTYAEAILNVCKLHLKTPLVCAAGVASSNLRERIEAIMKHQSPQSLDLGRKSLLAGVALAAFCGPLMMGVVSARQAPDPPLSRDRGYTFSFISPPGATSSTARGINNLGRIVGSFVDGRGTHAFLYRNGVFTTVDVPGSTWTIATGINNAGQIVGAHGAGGETGNHGFLLSGDSFSSFDYPDSLDTIANGINNKGQIVGTYTGSDGLRHGFRLSGGMYTLIEVPDSLGGSAEGINDSGQIVGLSGFDATATGFALNGQTYSPIRTAPGTFVIARAVNNLGDIVGQDGGPQAPFRGFLRSGTREVPIALPENPFAWNVQGVNDLGQLVGEMTDQSGRTLGYLATPTAFTPPSVDPPETNVAERSAPVTDPGLPGVARPQGRRGTQQAAASPTPAASPDRPGRGRGGERSGMRGMNAVRSALQRSHNALGRGGPGNLFAKRAMDAVSLAIDDASAAMAFIEAHPESAAMPPVPPRITPAFEPPASELGRYPGRQIPLNTLRDAFERLVSQPGGDLGGLRAKMYEQIARASSEAIADIVVRAREDDLERIAGGLQRSIAALNRASENDAHVQRAIAATQSAIEGINRTIAFVHEYPDSASGQPPAAGVSLAPADPPLPTERRYPSLEAALQGIRDAYAGIGRMPGGDFGGHRARIQTELGTAITEVSAAIDAAVERARERDKAPELQIDRLKFQ